MSVYMKGMCRRNAIAASALRARSNWGALRDKDHPVASGIRNESGRRSGVVVKPCKVRRNLASQAVSRVGADADIWADSSPRRSCAPNNSVVNRAQLMKLLVPSLGKSCLRRLADVAARRLRSNSVL